MGATPLMLVPVTTIVSAIVSASAVAVLRGRGGSLFCANTATLASDAAEMSAACEALERRRFLIFIDSPPRR